MNHSSYLLRMKYLIEKSKKVTLTKNNVDVILNFSQRWKSKLSYLTFTVLVCLNSLVMESWGSLFVRKNACWGHVLPPGDTGSERWILSNNEIQSPFYAGCLWKGYCPLRFGIHDGTVSQSKLTFRNLNLQLQLSNSL